MDLICWVKRKWGGGEVSASAEQQIHFPTFEQLEPRVLLSADSMLMPDAHPLEIHEAQVIVVELDQGTGVGDQGSGEEHGGLKAEDGLASEALAAEEEKTPKTEHRLTNSQERIASSESRITNNEEQAASCLQLDSENSKRKTDVSFYPPQFTLHNSILGPAQNRGPPSEVVFVDSSLNLVFLRENAVSPNVEVFYLPDEVNGIEFITDTLGSLENLSAIHIVSHGAPGGLALGDEFLDTEALNTYSGSIVNWGNSLTTEGDILLYGCSVGEGQEGATFIRKLADLTKGDVAASTDPTGNPEWGGDWELEIRTGMLEADASLVPIVSETLDHLLVTYTVDSTADNTDLDGSITLREAIEAANTNAQVGDAPAGSGLDADIIQFDISLSEEVIQLTGTQLTIREALNIVGPAGGLTVDANHTSGVFWIPDDVEVSLADLTVAGGQAERGGGIYNQSGALTLTNCTIEGNSAVYDGGGIFNFSGLVSMSNSSVDNNSAVGGGGIYNNSGSIELTGSSVSNNSADRGGGGL